MPAIGGHYFLGAEPVPVYEPFASMLTYQLSTARISVQTAYVLAFTFSV